jgi:hypothetical protein
MTQDHSALLAQLDALKSADASAVFAELIRAGLHLATPRRGQSQRNGIGQPGLELSDCGDRCRAARDGRHRCKCTPVAYVTVEPDPRPVPLHR